MRVPSPLPTLLASLALLAVPAQAFGAGDDHVVLSDPAAAYFPTSNEVQAAIDAARGHPWVTIQALGVSGLGQPLTVLAITDPDSVVPMDERVVTLIETQQHGNEPAGTGAAVPLLQDLLAGKPPADLLDNQVLLLLPMSNPDGASADTRGNDAGVDINRDHIALETSEARAIHAILNQWDVHVAVDHHEYGGTPATGLGNPVPVRIYDWDLTTMAPNHGNVRQPTLEAAASLNDAVWAAAEAHGYSVGDYGWTTVNGIKVEQTAGGPDPGILRNAFGLNNVAGLLGESFISGLPDNPFASAQRRIDIHRVVMDATLQFAHDNAADLIAAKRESERLNREDPLAEYLEPAAGTGTPEVRAALPEAFRVSQDLGELFGLHGLPMAAPVDGGFVHNVHGEARGGLVAAILHPQSSRHVVAGEAVSQVASQTPAHLDSTEATPIGLVAVLALVAALALARRQPPDQR